MRTASLDERGSLCTAGLTLALALLAIATVSLAYQLHEARHLSVLLQSRLDTALRQAPRLDTALRQAAGDGCMHGHQRHNATQNFTARKEKYSMRATPSDCKALGKGNALCVAPVDDKVPLRQVNLDHCLMRNTVPAPSMRCWLASHNMMASLKSPDSASADMELSLHLDPLTGLPDADLLLAAPEHCYQFATVGALTGGRKSNPVVAARLKANLVKTRIYPEEVTQQRLVLLDDGACLELFGRGIPQSVRALQEGTSTGRDNSSNARVFPQLSVMDYNRLLPPLSRPSVRALFRSSYPDPLLSEQLEHELQNESVHEVDVPLMPTPRRPAIIVATSHRYVRAAAEVWDAGFEPTRQPAIFSNISRCHPRPTMDPGARYLVNLDNTLDAFRQAYATISERNVPHALFEDDIVLASTRPALHRFLQRFEKHDVAAMGACARVGRRYACMHATYVSPSSARVLMKEMNDCSTLSTGVDKNAMHFWCYKGGRTCTNWQELQHVPNTGLLRRFKREQRYPLVTHTVRGVNVTREGPARFHGYGYFVQDRIGVTPTLHTASNMKRAVTQNDSGPTQ